MGRRPLGLQRRDIGAHIEQAFEIHGRSPLSILEIAMTTTKEYGDDAPGQGAVRAWLTRHHTAPYRLVRNASTSGGRWLVDRRRTISSDDDGIQEVLDISLPQIETHVEGQEMYEAFRAMMLAQGEETMPWEALRPATMYSWVFVAECNIIHG